MVEHDPALGSELNQASIRTSKEVRSAWPASHRSLLSSNGSWGRYLAMLREAAGLYQTDIARAVPCHRTTVTHAEAGSQLPDADFWETADSVVGANGRLMVQYDALIQARETHKAHQRAACRARANTELAKLASGDERAISSTPSNGLQLATWQGASLSDGGQHDALELARRLAASDVSVETLSRLEYVTGQVIELRAARGAPRQA